MIEWSRNAWDSLSSAIISNGFVKCGWIDLSVAFEEPPMPEITDNCIQALRDNHMIDEELSEICETESDLDDGCIYDDFTIILD